MSYQDKFGAIFQVFIFQVCNIVICIYNIGWVSGSQGQSNFSSENEDDLVKGGGG